MLYLKQVKNDNYFFWVVDIVFFYNFILIIDTFLKHTAEG